MPDRRLSRFGGLTVATAALLLTGCGSMIPDYFRPAAPVAESFPGAAPQPAPPAADIAWQDHFRDERLKRLIAIALANNRDLRVAVLNIEQARALVQVRRADELPSVGAGIAGLRQPAANGRSTTLYTAGLQVTGYEFDFFGRVRSLTGAALAQYLASAEARKTAQIALVSTVATTHVALQADDELLDLARLALASREQTLKLTQLRESAGAASLLELQAQQTLTAQGRVALAQATRQQAQDLNALALLLGQPVPAAAAASPSRLADEAWLTEVPAGLSSAVLLRRPDVIAAEQTMAAAQANIAAARAAFWPTISLTAQAGQASAQLSGLFQGGSFAYTLAANALLTVFDSGRRQANVDAAQASQQIAQAQYERAIQSAFRDTADALAGLATWRDQLAAQREQRDAARDTARLTELKATQGAASALERLDAQRALFAAEQAVVQVRLAELNNRVLLFKALGG